MKLTALMALCLGYSNWLGGMDLQTALNTFENRHLYLEATTTNHQTLREARNALKLQATLSESDKQMQFASKALRLYFFEGDFLYKKEGEDKKLRKQLFAECEEWVDIISPERIGVESQVYYLGINSCRAWKAEVGGLADALKLPRYFGGDEDSFYTGIEVGTQFLGGGIYRSGTAILVNPQSKILGLYKPQEALKMMNLALKVGQDPFDPYGRTGEDYCENYYYKAKAQAQLGDFSGASTTIDDAAFLFGIEFGDPVEVLEPAAGYQGETKVCAQRIQDFIKETDAIDF